MGNIDFCYKALENHNAHPVLLLPFSLRNFQECQLCQTPGHLVTCLDTSIIGGNYNVSVLWVYEMTIANHTKNSN